MVGLNSFSISSSPKSRELPLGKSSDMLPKVESETVLSLAAGTLLPGVPPVRLTGVLRGEGTASLGVEVALASFVGVRTRGEFVVDIPTSGFLAGLVSTPGDFHSVPGED